METEKYSQGWLTNREGKLPQSSPLKYRTRPEPSDEEKVARELGKIMAAARRRAIVIGGVTIAITALLLTKIAKNPPTYQGAFQLLVEPVTTSESRLQALLSETEGNKFATINGKDFSLDYATQIRVLKSPKVMAPITANIKEKYPDYDPTKITVERPFNEAEGTRILQISYSDPDEEKVQFVLEQISQGYLKYSLEDRQTNLRRGVRFIEQQVPQMQQRVDRLQEEIKRLRLQYNFMDPDFQGKRLLEQRNYVESKQLDIQTQLSQTRSSYETLRRLFEEGNYAAVVSKDGIAYGGLIKQSQEIETQLTEAEARLQEEHPTLIALRAQKRDLDKRIRQEAESMLKRAGSEVQGLSESAQINTQAQTDLNQQLTVLPTVARQYDELRRQLELATETLNQNVTKLAGLEIDVAQQNVPWELIAPPTTVEAPKASRKTQLLTGIVGLVMGIGVAFLLELLNNVFHTPEDLEDDTRLPLLGIIPFSKEIKKLNRRSAVSRKKLAPVAVGAGSAKETLGTLVVANGSQSLHYNGAPVLEAFRSLYTNIRLLSPDTPFQSLVIGAATPGEGKSTVALYLAQTAAAIGQRVLLVDADMRSPKIHFKLGLPNLRGLSDAIVTDISLNDAIQRSPVDDNLFVLTAGALPHDPIKLLSSKKMHSLMEQFQDFFDLVIYDTPPLVGLADGSILAAQTEGLVMVVKLDKTDRSMVMKALDGLKISGAPVLGVVANGTKG